MSTAESSRYLCGLKRGQCYYNFAEVPARPAVDIPILHQIHTQTMWSVTNVTNPGVGTWNVRVTPSTRPGQKCPGLTVHPPCSHISWWVDKGLVLLILHVQHLDKSTLIADVLKEMFVVQMRVRTQLTTKKKSQQVYSEFH